MPLPKHLILRVGACLSIVCLTSGCRSSDARAQAALGEYQAAAAANDLVSARRALLRLVRAKDDVADYWAELGKIQATMGSYGDAYYAFTRAYELDRSNPDLVRAVTQLALRSGDIARAQTHAKELEVLAPGDPWVKLTKGWAAVAQARFGQALAESDAMLVTSPFDPSATVLKARALIGLQREPDAVDLLKKQMEAQPSDAGSLQLLERIYVSHGDWTNAAQIAQRLRQLTPADRENALFFVEAAFRSGNTTLGRQASFQLLQPNADAKLIGSVLDLWASYWPSPRRLEDVRRLAKAAQTAEQKLAYAVFLSAFGSPADAVRLTTPLAGLPVNARNAEANAVLADAMSRAGNLAAAKARFDAVIAFDPGNATALRGRSELELRAGRAAAAVADAQKLVSVLPNSAHDRLLLARCFAAAGNQAWIDRTLWAAFQDIPADETIFAALAARTRGNAEAMTELREEFERQRAARVSRGFI